MPLPTKTRRPVHGRLVGDDISWSSLCRWRKAAKQGDGGLAAKAREGHLRLNPEQLSTLVAELKKGATTHGWPNELWTGERVATLIERLFHVRYTPDHVRVLLRERLGWTSQKSEKRGRERDEEEIARWRKEKCPRIKKTPNDEAPISSSLMNLASC